MWVEDDIKNSEEAFIPLLENFFKKNYSKDKLISHGLDHHRRVWDYAKELLCYREKDGNEFDLMFTQKLLIACYLHDIGMSIDTGVKHGHHSRALCIKFLREQNLDESDYEDLLSAIEYHDNKEYPGIKDQDLLLTILSVADDLDAFGETGISRYLEIYNERGIDTVCLGKTIRDNARKRFENFEKNFRKYPALVEKHRKRYLVLDIYFKTTS
jgi:HD superfamily phosphodiesterase